MVDKIQVVILCGGRGTRFASLTNRIPKVLVEVCSKSVLEHKLDILSEIASEIILVVGYMKEKIILKIGDNYKGIPVKYVEQEKQLGTGHALMCASSLLNGKFMVLNGDDIYSKDSLVELSEFEFGMIGIEVENPKNFGVLEIDEKDNLISIVEKPENPPSNLVGIGAYIFTNDIFGFELELSSRGEYEITDYLNLVIKHGGDIRVVSTDFWLPVGNPDELEIAEKKLCRGSD